MLSASRAAWFAAAFVFALPTMLVLFEDGGLTQGTWVQSVLFAASIAVVAATVFGRSTP